jgi:hypothetical protein
VIDIVKLLFNKKPVKFVINHFRAVKAYLLRILRKVAKRAINMLKEDDGNTT